MPTFWHGHAQLKLSGNGFPETEQGGSPSTANVGLYPACPLAARRLPSTSYMLWNLCVYSNHCPECPSHSHPTLFSHPRAAPAPPAPLGWVQSTLTTLSCNHSFPACFLHRMLSYERARIAPCSSFLSHQCQAEKMLKSVRLVNRAKRRENMLEITPYSCLLPSAISSGDGWRCTWDRHHLSKANLEHPSK